MPLSPRPTGFPIQLLSGAAAGHNPAASTTYFFSAAGTSNPGTTTTNEALTTVIPQTGRLTKCWVNITVAGTTASAGNVNFMLRHNNSADITINATFSWSGDATPETENLDLNTAVTAGDQIEAKFTTPAWGTTPTIVFYRVMLWIEVP
jgi:hypothetical protein